MSDKKHQVFVLGVDKQPLTPTNWRKAKKLIIWLDKFKFYYKEERRLSYYLKVGVPLAKN